MSDCAILKLLGLLGVLLWVYTYVRRLFFLRPVSLRERYGENSWAVVTGGSEGIGLSICKHLAQEGFNVAIIARSLEKMRVAKEEILKVNQLVDVLTISMDFSKSDKAEFFQELASKLESLDVSILVNNVGILPVAEFGEQSSEDIRNTIVVNCCSQVGMTKLIVPKLKARNNKGAIIDLSSTAAFSPIPVMPIYAGSKAFNDFFSQGLSFYVDGIDFLTVNPGLVSTAMTQHRQVGGSVNPITRTVSTKDVSDGIFAALGNLNRTSGAWFQSLTLGIAPAFYSLIPEDLKKHVIKQVKEANSLRAWMGI